MAVSEIRAFRNGDRFGTVGVFTDLFRDCCHGLNDALADAVANNGAPGRSSSEKSQKIFPSNKRSE